MYTSNFTKGGLIFKMKGLIGACSSVALQDLTGSFVSLTYNSSVLTSH